jgi:cyclomaltodextrinase / maltogenic alpha-amylase / neopullulanase
MRTLRAPAIGLLLTVGAAASGAEAPPPLRSGPPSWAADAVWYEIVPERFRNGDPRNDPRSPDLRGAWPNETPRDWQIAPWTSNWYALLPWERASGRDFYTAVATRRYGGDLQGILASLDHLQGLGVSALCLTPIFKAPSALKYDPAAFHHVDNNLGPDPEGDRLVLATENPADPATWKWTSADRLFLRLIQECHRRQIKVVIDGVFDHVGQTFWAFRDLRARGQASKYAAWFAVKTYDDPKTPQDELDYASRSGARELPELRKDGDTLAAGPREHIHAIVKRWGDPNGDGDPSDGVDGWRLPGAEKIGHGFWRELRRWVLGLNPEAILVGHVLWADYAAARIVDPAPWLNGDELDAVMSYRFADAAKSFFIDRNTAISAAELDTRLAELRTFARPETATVLLNLLDSHDTDRVASQIVNPDRAYDHDASPKDNPRYEVRAPRAEEQRRLRLLAAFQFAAVGAPIVYYGTEAGMWGADDPDDQKPMLWRDLKYEDEAGHPLGQPRKPDPVRFDEDLYKFYSNLGRMRSAQAALRRGSLEVILADEKRRVYAFQRVLDNERVAAAFNASDKEQAVELPMAVEQVRDWLGGRKYRTREGKVALSLPPLGAVILAPDTKAP